MYAGIEQALFLKRTSNLARQLHLNTNIAIVTRLVAAESQPFVTGLDNCDLLQSANRHRFPTKEILPCGTSRHSVDCPVDASLRTSSYLAGRPSPMQTKTIRSLRT
ncbi:hypothetical protein HYQ44_011774 [Verticillium longisporum]|nr:hypothetical protein HYQ44_011774 [Verticillium longisporum]